MPAPLARRTLRLALLLLPLLLALAACARGPQPQDLPAADSAKVLIRYQWTPQDVANPPRSFNVYRADSATGPYGRLNATPIVSPTPREGKIVTIYKDVGGTLGRTYFYYLERVGKEGATSRVAPPAPARAVLPLQAEDLEEYRAWRQSVRDNVKSGDRPAQPAATPARTPPAKDAPTQGEKK